MRELGLGHLAPGHSDRVIEKAASNNGLDQDRENRGINGYFLTRNLDAQTLGEFGRGTEG